MKQTVLRYIELKTGYHDDGPAWIGYVLPSKTGRTLYFNDRALRAENGGAGNYYDVETGERFWVTGVKQRESNRHRAARARVPVQIDRRAVEEFRALTGLDRMNPNEFLVVDLEDRFPIERIRKLENRSECVKEIP